MPEVVNPSGDSLAPSAVTSGCEWEVGIRFLEGCFTFATFSFRFCLVRLLHDLSSSSLRISSWVTAIVGSGR